MNRLAIIIESSHVAGEDDLPGARLDARNWEEFLASELGGAWDKSEIYVRHSPSSAEVRSILNIHQNDYIFLVFSGHGCESNGRVYCCLNDKELLVDSWNLTPWLGTAVFDCCRGVPEESGRVAAMDSCKLALANESYSVCNSARLQEIIRREVIKNTFMNNIRLSGQNHTVRMFACAKGQGADESPEAGGLYTSLLIDGARERKKSFLPGLRSNVYTTYEAHVHAKTEMLTVAPQQTPEYYPDGLQYPFAILG